MSPYLGLSLRSLEDLAADLERELADLKMQKTGWAAALSREPVPYSMQDHLRAGLDELADKIGKIEAHLEVIDEELEYRNRRCYGGDFSPIRL